MMFLAMNASILRPIAHRQERRLNLKNSDWGIETDPHCHLGYVIASTVFEDVDVQFHRTVRDP